MLTRGVYRPRTRYARRLRYLRSVAGAPALGTIAITNPIANKPHRVSLSTLTGSITANGTFTGDASGGIEARWNGGAWTACTVGSGTWSVTLSSQAMGDGTFSVRFVADTSVTASAANVKVCPIWGVGGQSNGEGRFSSFQSWTAPGANPTWKPALFKQGAAAGAWVEMAEPTDRDGFAGSLAPLFATLLMAAGIPAAVITLADSGTGLTNGEWSVGGTEYNQAVTNISNSGQGLSGMIFVQGERDVDLDASGSSYQTALLAMAAGFYSAITGNPETCVVQLGYADDNGGTIIDGIRSAQSAAWDAGGRVFGGPSVYDISNALHPSGGGNPDSLGVVIARRIWAAINKKYFGGTYGRGPKLSSATYDASRTVITLRFDQTLKTGLSFTNSAFGVTANGVAATISSIMYGADGQSVALHLSAAAALPITATMGSGNSTASKTYPVGPDITVPTGETINLPPVPFVGQSVSAATSGGGGSIFGGAVVR